MTDVPHSLAKHLKISHPDYAAGFEKLDLKWGRFPALARFGFDIGGIQYTAAPFIGWLVASAVELVTPLTVRSGSWMQR